MWNNLKNNTKVKCYPSDKWPRPIKMSFQRPLINNCVYFPDMMSPFAWLCLLTIPFTTQSTHPTVETQNRSGADMMEMSPKTPLCNCSRFLFFQTPLESRRGTSGCNSHLGDSGERQLIAR